MQTRSATKTLEAANSDAMTVTPTTRSSKKATVSVGRANKQLFCEFEAQQTPVKKQPSEPAKTPKRQRSSKKVGKEGITTSVAGTTSNRLADHQNTLTELGADIDSLCVSENWDIDRAVQYVESPSRPQESQSGKATPLCEEKVPLNRKPKTKPKASPVKIRSRSNVCKSLESLFDEVHKKDQVAKKGEAKAVVEKKPHSADVSESNILPSSVGRKAKRNKGAIKKAPLNAMLFETRFVKDKFLYVLTGCEKGSNTYYKAQQRLARLFTGYTVGHNFNEGDAVMDATILKMYRPFMFGANQLLHTRKYNQTLVEVRFAEKDSTAFVPVGNKTTVSEIKNYCAWLFKIKGVSDGEIKLYASVTTSLNGNNSFEDVLAKHGKIPWYMFVSPGPYDMHILLPSCLEMDRIARKVESKVPTAHKAEQQNIGSAN